MSSQQESTSKGWIIVITSIIGVIGTITVAYFAFRGAIFPAQLEIEASQTAQSIVATQIANSIWITQTAHSIEVSLSSVPPSQVPPPSHDPYALSPSTIPTATFVPSPTNIPPTQVPPTAIPPTLEPPVGSEAWRQQLEPLWDGTISSVLIVGKFRRQSDLVGLSLDDQRNILITELSGRTNQSGGYYQSLDNDTLAGVGALLVFVRAAKIRNDQDLKTITDDDIRNIFIVEIYARTGRADLQGLSNIQLVRLALSLQW